MKTYSLEVRNCVTIEVEANDPEEARMMLVDNHELWKEDLCENPYCNRTAKIHTAHEFICEECFKGLNEMILENCDANVLEEVE